MKPAPTCRVVQVNRLRPDDGSEGGCADRAVVPGVDADIEHPALLSPSFVDVRSSR